MSTRIVVAATPFLVTRPADCFTIQPYVLYQLAQACPSPGEGTAFLYPLVFYEQIR